MNRSTRSRNELQNFEFPDLGRKANNMANGDDSVNSNSAASVDGGTTAKAPEQWCENPRYGDFNPGTSHGRDIFSKKTKGLADDKKFDVTTKDAGAICKFPIGK